MLQKKAARFLLPIQSQSSLTWVLISKHPKEDKQPKSAAKNTKKYELWCKAKRGELVDNSLFLIGAYKSILPTGTLFLHVRFNIVYKADF